MELDRALLEQTLTWLGRAEPVTWITVAETFGASPRPVGSMMAISNGHAVGSVSGGCVEESLLETFSDGGPEIPRIERFGISRDDAQRARLPCGGELAVVCESVRDASHVTELIDATTNRRPISRTIDLASGAVSISNAEKSRLTKNDFTAAYGPPWRIVMTGAGDLSQYVASIADTLGYQIEVIEPRKSFREAWSINVGELSAQMPDDYLRDHPPDEHTICLALTHDLKIDDLMLIDALTSRAWYVGALGSMATQTSRLARLRDHFALTVDQLDRLHAPVGLNLGSREPQTIAIAILAEITALRNNVSVTSTRETA